MCERTGRANVVVNESSSVTSESKLSTPQDFHTDSPRTKSSCMQCIRAGNECVLAGSRRGGDYSRFRRSQNKQSATPSVDVIEIDRDQTAEEKREGLQGNGDPIYAELANPGDALQILARLAANDNQRPNEPEGSPPLNTWTTHKSLDQVSAKESPKGNSSSSSIPPPLVHTTLSETETLVMGVIGTDTVTRLINQ